MVSFRYMYSMEAFLFLAALPCKPSAYRTDTVFLCLFSLLLLIIDGGRDGKAAPPRLTRACLTVLQLLHERGRGPASPFYPYLCVLPRDHRLPMEWNETELKLLKACMPPFPCCHRKGGKKVVSFRGLVSCLSSAKR